MVAPSFQKYEIVGEPFSANGKMYVKLSNNRTVRWYTDAQYEKLYPTKEKTETTDVSVKRSKKEVLGFSLGFITIFKGDTYAQLDWFRESVARYNKIWGWFIPSEIDLPQDLPEGIAPVRLEWSQVSLSDNELRAEKDISEAVDALLCDPSPSEYIGKVGDRIEIKVKVLKAVSIEGYYGHSTLHTFIDDNENIYIWSTTAKNLPVDNVYTLRGTIKDHSIFKNTKQNVLTRCTIIKEWEVAENG